MDNEDINNLLPDEAWDDILMRRLTFFIRRGLTMAEVINRLEKEYSAMEIMTRWSVAYAIVKTRISLDEAVKRAGEKLQTRGDESE